MEVLAIRKDVDLDILFKLGFKKENYVNGLIYKYQDDYSNYVIGEDRIIHYNQFTVNNKLNKIIFILVKANLIEVVNIKRGGK